MRRFNVTGVCVPEKHSLWRVRNRDCDQFWAELVKTEPYMKAAKIEDAL